MARRPRRGVTALLIVAALWGCTGAETVEPTTSSSQVTTTTWSTTTTASTTTTTIPPTTTTTIPPTTTTTVPPTTTSTLADIDAEVTVPAGDGPFPAVVLVHGGAWVSGDPGQMDPLAETLNDHGFLTVNTRYTLATLDRPGFPDAIDDVACAVRHAAAHPDSDGTVAVVGHSAGAHIGAVVALTGDDYAEECPVSGNGIPDGFVGLAGPYDVSRLGLAVAAFFGGRPESRPGAWEAGNPQRLTDANTALEALIVYGDRDVIVPESFAIPFHEALTESGTGSLLEAVEGASHFDMHDPDVVGDTVVTWLER